MSDDKLWNTSTARWLFIGLMAALLAGFLICSLLSGLLLLPNLGQFGVGAVVRLLVWLLLSSGVVVLSLATGFLVLRRVRRMDTIAEKMGLESTALDISTYEYTGAISGRQVRVRFYLGAQIFLFVRARTGPDHPTARRWNPRFFPIRLLATDGAPHRRQSTSLVGGTRFIRRHAGAPNADSGERGATLARRGVGRKVTIRGGHTTGVAHRCVGHFRCNWMWRAGCGGADATTDDCRNLTLQRHVEV